MGRRGADRTAATAAPPLRLFAARQTADRHELEGEGLFMAAFAASPDGLAMLDANGRLLQINAAGQALLSAATCGRDFAAAVVPEARLALETALVQARSGKPASVECQASDKGPWLELAIAGFQESEARYVLVAVRNIEAQRRLQEHARLASAQEALNHLAGGLAHDLNNILTVIIGNGELLAERLGGDEASRTLTEISLSAARAGADLTRLLLASARPQMPHATEFCAAHLVSELRGLIERTVGADITLNLRTDPDGWSIRADRAQLASVVLNLTLNACHAMPKGGELTIDVRNIGSQTDEEGDRVLLGVSDTGSGIPAAILERVFEPFFTTKSSGTGLGLPMAQAFARQAGGDLAIRSAPGVGTTVSLHLPRAQTQLGLPHLEPPIADQRARPGEAVFVVERDAAVQGLIISQLKALGYATRSASSLKTALALLDDAERVDLFLSDLSLWNAEGAELGRRLRKLRPQMPILFVSGESGGPDGSGRRGKLPGRLLAKPFTRLELARRVRSAIDDTI
jgi:signal transduction histidine kinase/CheY-like chemotaxis protein